MEDMILPILAKQNIWWEGRIKDDAHLRRWESMTKRWIPFQLEQISTQPFSLNIIIGPRQTGKTTLIKFAISKLIEAKVNEKTILYLRCDEITDSTELRKIIETFFAYANTKKTYLFLDEITQVQGWENTVKGFVDDGDFLQAVVTISGSNAFSLQKGAELFPGRRGYGKDIRVLPLSFRQYLQIAQPKLIEKIPQASSIDIENETIEPVLLHMKQLQKHLYDYMQCGGFPLAVNSYLQNLKVEEQAKEVYMSWLIGDILKAKKSDRMAREILKVMLSKMPTPVSWEAIAQETSIKTAQTVASYVELFEQLFVVLPLYHIEPNKKTIEFAKNKKLHLFDPLLYHIVEEWCMQPILAKTQLLAEAILAVHVARFLSEKKIVRRMSDNVGFWKNGYEIDVVALQPQKKPIGYEMKWSDKKELFRVKKGAVGELRYISKNYYNEQKPKVIPLAVFLSML